MRPTSDAAGGSAECRRTVIACPSLGGRAVKREPAADARFRVVPAVLPPCAIGPERLVALAGPKTARLPPERATEPKGAASAPASEFVAGFTAMDTVGL